MSQVIDEKVVEMQFDNSDFETNVKESLSTIDQLKKSLDLSESAKTFENVSKAAGDVSFDGLSSGIEAVKTNFSAFEMMALGALANIGAKAADVGLKFVQSFSTDLVGRGFNQYESKTKAVQTIMNATGESIESVDNRMEKLIWYADETSASFSDMVNNVGKFTAAGVDIDQATNAMMGIFNWASVSGAGVQEASRAMYNLSQAMGMGAVTALDWKSIENANMATKEFKQQVIDTAIAMGKLTAEGKTLDKGTQVTAENFRSTIAEKWFDNDVLVSVLGKYSDYTNLVYDEVVNSGVRCSEAMATVAENMGGSFDAIGQKAFTAAQEAKTFTDAIEAVEEAVGSQWSTLFENAFGNYEEAKVTWTNLTNSLWEVFAGPLENVNEAFGEALEAPKVDVAEWNNLRDEIKTNLNLTNEEFDDFKNTLKEVATENGIDVDSMIEKWGGFESSIAGGGWLDSNILQKTFDKIQEGAVSSGDALTEVQDIVNKIWSGEIGTGEDRVKAIEELGYNYDEIQALVEKGYGVQLTVDDLTESMLNTASSSSDALSKIKEALDNGDLQYAQEFAAQLSGAEVRNAFWDNLFNSESGAIVSYTGAIREAFAGVFGTIDSGGIRSIIDRLYMFSEKLLDEDRISKFQNRVKNIFSILHTGLTILKGVWGVLKSIFSNTIGAALSGIFDIVMSIADGIGGLFSDLDEGTTIVDAFTTAINWLNEKLAPIKNVIEVVSNGITKFINGLFSGKTVLQSFKESVRSIINGLLSPGAERRIANFKFDEFINRVTNLKDSIVNAFETIKNKFHEAVELFKNTELGDWISQVFDKVKNAFSSAWESIKGWFKNLFGVDKDTDLSFITDFQDAIDGFCDWIDNLELSSKVETVSDAVIDFKDKVKEAFGGIKTYFEENETFQTVMETVKEKFGELKESVIAEDEENKEQKEPFIVRILNGLKTVFEWFMNNMPSLDELFKILLGVLSGTAVANLVLVIKKIKDLFSGGTGFVKNINKILGGIGNALNAFAVEKMGKGVLYVAAAIGVLALSLALLTVLDAGKLMNAAVALGVVAAGVGLLISAIMQAKQAQSSTKKGSSSLKEGFTGLIDSVSGFVDNMGSAMAKSMKINAYTKMILAITVAVAVIAAAVYKLAQLDLDKLLQGIGAVVAILLAVIGAIKLLNHGTSSSFSLSKSGITSNKVGTSGMIDFVGLAYGVLGIAEAVSKLSQYSLTELLSSIAAMGAILLEISLFARFTKDSITFGESMGILMIGVAMIAFAKSISELKDMELGEVLVGVLAIGAILAEIVAFSKFTKSIKVKDTIAIAALGGALLIFVQSLKQLAGIEIGQMFTGLAGMAVILATIAGFTWVISKIATDTEKLSGILVGISAIIAAVSAAIWAVGDALSKGVSLEDIGSSIGDLAAGLVEGLVNAITGSADAIIGGVLSLLETAATYAPQIIDTLVGLIVNVLGSLTTRIPELATAIADFCGALITAFAEAFAGVDTTDLISAINEILFATASLALIGHFGDFKSLTTGIGMMAEVIGAFGLIIAAFGALNLIPGFTEFMEGGVDTLITIAGGIGGFFGTLVGSALGSGVEAFSSSLPAVGTNLAEFMTNAQPFFDNASKIDSTFVDSVGNLTGAMLMVTGANFVDTVVNGLSWLFGGGTSTDYIAKFADLGAGLAAFADSIKDVDFTTVDNAASAAGIITALADVVPKEGGLWQMIVGTQNFDNIDQKFSNLGVGVAAFCNAVSGITAGEDTVEKASTAADAISALMEVVPNEGGLLQWLTGAPDLTNAGTDFQHLGEGVYAFCSAVSGITTGQDTIDKASTAAEAVAALIAVVPKEGGLIQWITGAPSLENAGTDFTNLGAGVVAFCDAVSGITTGEETIEKASTAADAITALMAVTPSDGGLWQYIAGKPDLENAKTHFTNLGEGVSAFCEAIQNITLTDETASTVDSAAKALSSLLAVTPNDGGLWQWIAGKPDLENSKTNFQNLGEGVAAFCTAIEGVTVGTDAVKAAAASAIIISKIMEVAPSTATGGLWQEIAGEVALDKLGDNLAILGEGIAAYVSSTSTITDDDSKNAITAAQAIIDIMALSWPTEGGIANFFSDIWGGNVEFTDIESDIKDMAQTIKTFVTEMGGVESDSTSIDNAKTAAEAIIDLISMDWPKEGGIAGFFSGLFSGGVVWSDLKTKLPDMGGAIKAFADSVEGITTESTNNAKRTVGTLKTIMELIPEDATGFANVVLFSEKIKDLGDALVEFNTDAGSLALTTIALTVSSIRSLITTLETMADIDFDKASAFSDTLGTLAETGITEFTTAFTDSEESTITTVNNYIASVILGLIQTTLFNAAGSMDASGFNAGLGVGGLGASTVASTIASNAANAMNLYYSYYNSAYYSIQGYINGLYAMSGQVIRAANSLADLANISYNKRLQIASPSKRFEWSAKMSVLGIVGGWQKYGYLSENAASEAAEGQLNVVRSAFENLDTNMLDAAPVIRPVLDLTDVQNGAGTIDDLLHAETIAIDTLGVNKLANAINSEDATSSIYDDSSVIAVINDLGNRVDKLNGAINNIKLYLNGRDLVGGVIADIDDALGDLSDKRQKGVL